LTVETELVLRDGTQWTARDTTHTSGQREKQHRTSGYSALRAALGNMSRELRGPLADLAILIELVEAERAARGTPSSAITGASQDGSTLPFDALRHRILDNIRATGDPLGFKPHLLDFSAVVLDAVRLSWPLAESHNVALVHSSTPPTVTSGDSRLLLEATDAIVSRLIRASPAGSIVTCHVAESQANLSVRITSNARDIDIWSMNRALRPFERGNNADRTTSLTEDIDIWTARMIAERHGGYVRRVTPARTGHDGVELSIPASWG
jgi:two-component system, OmpR family, sensor histidine kinase SenX3